MDEKTKELVSLLSSKCDNMQDIHDLLKELFKGTIEEMLEAEMDEHLGYDKHNPLGDLTGNSRNGYNKKTIQTQMGKIELKIPRDQNGEFEPQLIEKYLIPQMTEWQSRQLDNIYAVVFLDGIYFKVKKDSRVINKCVYSVLGINLEGKKEILGIWISETESASFWTCVCNELKNRGVQDILLTCHDNLSGFSGAINWYYVKKKYKLNMNFIYNRYLPNFQFLRFQFLPIVFLICIG